MPKFMVTKSLDRNVSKCKKDLALNYTHQRKHSVSLAISPKQVEPRGAPGTNEPSGNHLASSGRISDSTRLLSGLAPCTS